MLNEMKQRRKALLLVLVMAMGSALAQLDLTQSTINSGGINAENDTFKLSGSIAQVDASQQLAGDDFLLTGGFWQQNNDLIFKNGLQ